jgi:hypothetical protein
LGDDDLQLSLYCVYELSYRGFRGVSPRRELDPVVQQVRSRLSGAFEDALRGAVDVPPVAGDASSTMRTWLNQIDGPSLSTYLLEHGSLRELREFMVHRSAYQLKEADPHSWLIPRLSPGPRKSALIEIQTDEYGRGRPGESHAELFAQAMDAAGLDPTYGAHLHRLPGVTLATCNLISLFGSERRLAGALLGHLAAFEMTSVEPMHRYRMAMAEHGLPDATRRFYDVHVDADVHHGRLAEEVLIGGDLESDGVEPSEVLFGAAALIHVEDRFARHLLQSWADHRSSFVGVADRRDEPHLDGRRAGARTGRASRAGRVLAPEGE